MSKFYITTAPNGVRHLNGIRIDNPTAEDLVLIREQFDTLENAIRLWEETSTGGIGSSSFTVLGNEEVSQVATNTSGILLPGQDTKTDTGTPVTDETGVLQPPNQPTVTPVVGGVPSPSTNNSGQISGINYGDTNLSPQQFAEQYRDGGGARVDDGTIALSSRNPLGAENFDDFYQRVDDVNNEVQQEEVDRYAAFASNTSLEVHVPANDGSDRRTVEQEDDAEDLFYSSNSYGDSDSDNDNDDGRGQRQSTTVESSILNDPVYGSIVRGWNQKLDAQNNQLSSLTPFAELYTIFSNDDIVFSEDINKFSGVSNRVIDVRFTNPSGTGPPSLPVGLEPNSKVAKIAGPASQLEMDFATKYGQLKNGELFVESSERTYNGSPGITDVAISRASSGAYNIKYDLSITMPNPEIMNDQYEYSKLLLLRSNFLLIHGWNTLDTDFTSDQGYPPRIIQSNNGNTIDVPLNTGNNGFWTASIITLYSFDFEFDNVGHLVGKLRFLTTQGAFMSAIGTDQVASNMIDGLNKVGDPMMLNRVPGSNDEEKQKAIFESGIPWSKVDQSGDQQELNNAALNLSLKQFYESLNDTSITTPEQDRSVVNEIEEIFSKQGLNENQLSNEKVRFDRVSGLVRAGVAHAAGAVRDIFSNWRKNEALEEDEIEEIVAGTSIERRASNFAHSIVPYENAYTNGQLDRAKFNRLYSPPTIDNRFIFITTAEDAGISQGEKNNWRTNISSAIDARGWSYVRSIALSNGLRPVNEEPQTIDNKQFLRFLEGDEDAKDEPLEPTGNGLFGASNNGTAMVITYFSEKDSFGTEDMRDASRDFYWDAFTAFEGDQDLRNYYYNNVLMSYANTSDEIEFLPPKGYGFDSNGKLVAIQGPGQNITLTRERVLSSLKNMGKGMLTDRRLIPLSTAEVPKPVPSQMPRFGTELQRKILNNFKDQTNPNYDNFRDLENENNMVISKPVLETIKRTSVLSIPSLVTAPKNPAVPLLPTSPAEALENGDVLFKMIIVRKFNIGLTPEEIAELEDAGQTQDEIIRVYKIEFPMGGFSVKDDLFSFVNDLAAQREGLNVNDIVTLRPDQALDIDRLRNSSNRRKLVQGTTIKVTKEVDGVDIEENLNDGGFDSDLTVGTDEFFYSRQVFILSSGYYLDLERTNPRGTFDLNKKLVPRPIFRGENVFLPELLLIVNDAQDLVPEEMKKLIINLIDSTEDKLRVSQIATRKDLGTVANINVTINDIEYNVIMRPSFYFLGSVLEALSFSLNRNVKFYYRELPSRATADKPITIPIPESTKSPILKEIDDEIFFINSQLVKLGAENKDLVGDVKRSDFIDPDDQTEEEEAKVEQDYLELVVKWHELFSEFMKETILDNIEQGFTTKERVSVEFDNRALLEKRPEFGVSPLVPIQDRTSIFQPKSISIYSSDPPEDLNDEKFEEFIRERFKSKRVRSQYNSDNGRGVIEYYFFLREGIRDPFVNNQGAIDDRNNEAAFSEQRFSLGTYDPTDFPTGIYVFKFALGGIGGLTDEFNYAKQFLRKQSSFPNINDILNVRVNPLERDLPTIERLKATGLSLYNEKKQLGFDAAFSSMHIKTTYEIPVPISSVEQMLRQESGAPTHNLLKKLLAACTELVPQLRLSMRPFSTDPKYIDVFVNAINVDGVVTEVSNEVDANDLKLVGEGAPSVDLYRRSLQREGTFGYTKSDKVMVCNFGTQNSLVENFQMSSKIDANAYANFRVPATMGGASLDISNVLNSRVGNLEQSGVLSDIISILRDGPIGGDENFRELGIVEDDGNPHGRQGRRVNRSKLLELLTGQSSPIIRKTAQSFIEDLMSQDVKLSQKILALQGEYFEGLTQQTSATQAIGTGRGEAQRLQGSRFYGNILNTYLRTITLTIHGTTNLNVFNYIYLKGLLSGVEGLYVISSINESITPNSFTTTIECKLVEYTQNDKTINPLAYRGEGSIRRFAEISRRQRRLSTGDGGDATVSLDFAEIAEKAEIEDRSNR